MRAAEENPETGGLRHYVDFPPEPGPISVDQTTPADRAALRTMATGAGHVIEVGTFLGGTAEVLLEAMPEDGHLLTVDRFTGELSAEASTIPAEFMRAYVAERLKRFGARVTILAGNSLDVAGEVMPGQADMIFIDAGHDYASVMADIAAWMPALKPDGLMVGHDFDKPGAERLAQVPAEWLAREVGDDNCHYGVIAAVRDSFTQIGLSKSPDSSIWAAKPQWTRTHDRERSTSPQDRHPGHHPEPHGGADSRGLGLGNLDHRAGR